jgi:hypothetical protein
VVPGESYDAEQWERFRQFQEFQRFEGSQRGGTPAPPPKRTPTWRKVLFSKWLRRLILLTVLLLAARWALDHYFGDPDQDLPASETGGHKTSRNVIQARSPVEGVRLFYTGVAEGDNEVARNYTCNRFATQELADRFADHFGAPSCQVAVERLFKEVTNHSDFAWPQRGTADYTPKADGSVVVSSCALDVSGGPRLGQFTFEIVPDSLDQQWMITQHEKEAEDCR